MHGSKIDSVVTLLRRALGRGAKKVIGAFGNPRNIDPWHGLNDIAQADQELILSVDNYTMTGPARRYQLIEAVRYVVKHRIPGAVVECGVWRGGSMMLAARTLLDCGDTSRDLYLYDTFEGMPAPSSADKDWRSVEATQILLADDGNRENSYFWAIASLPEVKRNLLSIGYPSGRIHFVQGKVEQTLSEICPDQISVLRLDTDWYESTAHELKYLYPKVCRGGVVIIDDYGYWQGARRAVDEFISLCGEPIFLNRIDTSCRCFVRP
ncbi:MAG: methyltransferase [Alphaproteobacteria bacterium]|nr:methyltransferase [Alphaproteobacteria bacterium]